MAQNTQTAATVFIEEIGGTTKVRSNFVTKTKTFTAYGREDQQILFFQQKLSKCFRKVESAIFIRSLTNYSGIILYLLGLDLEMLISHGSSSNFVITSLSLLLMRCISAFPGFSEELSASFGYYESAPAGIDHYRVAKNG